MRASAGSVVVVARQNLKYDKQQQTIRRESPAIVCFVQLPSRMLKSLLETPKKGNVVVTTPTPTREVPYFLRLPARFGGNRDFPLYEEKSNVVVIANDADEALLQHVCELNEQQIPNIHKVIFTTTICYCWSCRVKRILICTSLASNI